MTFLCLLSCFTFIWVAFGSGVSAGEPELSIIPRIINGTDTHPGSWPWHVALQTEYGKIFCGGTLIDRFWVMTAAHCNITTAVRVITGLFDRSSPLDKTQFLRIDKIFLHPNFSPQTFFGDIALLKLSTPANVHNTVSPALLPSFDEVIPVKTRCVTMGWGHIHPKRAMVPVNLQQATVAIISNAECKKHRGRHLSPTMVCARAKDVGLSSGDSGGPLVCPKDGLWKVVGIASHIHKLKPTIKPTVFTRVTAFIPWVEEMMAHN